MKIIVNISETGNIIYSICGKDGYVSKYIPSSNYDDVLILKKRMTETLKKSKKVNKTYGEDLLDVISFNDGKNEIEIHGYNNNNDEDLQVIISAAKQKYLDDKKKQLRKKVRRVSCFVGATIISIGLAVNALASSNNKKEEIPVDYSHELLLDENFGADIPYEEIKLEDMDIPDGILKGNQENNIVENTGIIVENPNKESVQTDLYNLKFEDRTGETKFINCKTNYGNLISEKSKEYGIDPQIILAIATQECGVHDINIGGPALGIMQIELSVWDGNDITAFNYSTGQLETVHITKEKLKDVDFNVKVGCMIFQNCLKDSNNNLEVAIQMYNYGYGNVLKAMKMCYGDDITLKKVTDNYDDEWLEYRNNIPVGDKLYLEHILGYVENPQELYVVDKDNNKISFSFNNNTKML